MLQNYGPHLVHLIRFGVASLALQDDPSLRCPVFGRCDGFLESAPQIQAEVVIVRPRANFDAPAAERTLRWALAAGALAVVQVWENAALHAVFGLDWLGTKSMLCDPTFVGGFGYWRVNRVE